MTKSTPWKEGDINFPVRILVISKPRRRELERVSVNAHSKENRSFYDHYRAMSLSANPMTYAA